MCLQDEGAFTTLVVALPWPARHSAAIVASMVKLVLSCVAHVSAGRRWTRTRRVSQYNVATPMSFINWCSLCNGCCFLAAAQCILQKCSTFSFIHVGACTRPRLAIMVLIALHACDPFNNT